MHAHRLFPAPFLPSRLASSLLASALLAMAGASTAQTRHDSAAPIDFGADHIELQDKANRAILTGSVTVRQAEMTLSAARMTVAYTGQVVDGSPQVSRLDASGGVTVTRPDQSARSQYAVYDIQRREITMLGNVMLVQGGNPVNGGRLRIDLDSGRAYLDGGAAVGGNADGVTSSGGRVTGRFSVPKRDK
ncbi:MAG: LptA/OstA family protein [Sphingomonas sp.]|uniref:LptA/OstA family protein n=1 Tax=Sphingomonas sp. TaxID=28214 RepID=UPI0035A904F5|nr:LptA/OstA family protein [Sphingomonas sp.]